MPTKLPRQLKKKIKLKIKSDLKEKKGFKVRVKIIKIMSLIEVTLGKDVDPLKLKFTFDSRTFLNKKLNNKNK